MHILMVTTCACRYFQYAIELEIMQRHLDAGDTVVNLHCDGSLLACEDNIHHQHHHCGKCMGQRIAGLSLLSPAVVSMPYLHLTKSDRREIARVVIPATLEPLRALQVEDFDIGRAVLSSLISRIRDPKPALSGHGNLPRRFLISALAMYRSVQHYLDEHRVDVVYVFNGRFASDRAVVRAAQSRKIPFVTFERGHDMYHYAVFKNSLPHNVAYAYRHIKESWEADADKPDRDAIAEQFFCDRMRPQKGVWYSFIDEQKTGLLPPGWDPKKRNVVIFNSSEDEFEDIDEEWANLLYHNQQDALERIIASLTRRKHDLHLYLRVHPNLRGVDNTQTKQIASLSAPFLTVIRADDPVSTYTLAKCASKILTFGSTMGIEACYLGVPSILAGQSFYRDLGGTYNPESHEELMSCLLSDLPPKPKKPALMYGYYMNSFGIPMKYYKAQSMGYGTFKGQYIVRKASRIEAFIEQCSSVWRYGRNIVFALQTRMKVLNTWRLHVK